MEEMRKRSGESGKRLGKNEEERGKRGEIVK